MKVGVNLINFGQGVSPQSLKNWAQFSESLGYHLLMASDHIAISPDVHARYPAPFYEPIALLGWLAGVTSTIELGTTVLIVLVTYLLALTRPGSVFTLAIWCFSGFASLFPLVFASVYWKHVTKAGAYASVLTTAGVWIWLFWKAEFGANREYLFMGMVPVATMIASSTAALVLVSLVTRPPSVATVSKFIKM